MGFALVVPGDLDRPTGGNRYDLALLDAWDGKVEARPVPGAWPVGSASDRGALRAALHGTVLVDGLLACGAPEEVDDAVARGARVHVLVHMPLALDPGLDPHEASYRNILEGKALRAASGVIATSTWTADDLRDRHGLDAVTVARPGTAPAVRSVGSDPPLVLHLAAVTPMKNQLTVVDALARIVDHPWQARLTGPTDPDPGYVEAVRARIDHHGLGDRIALTGPLTGDALDRLWSATDLLLLPSRAETWGMTVTEALARGVPAVVSRGTGAQEALGSTPAGLPGAVVDPTDPGDLAIAIEALLGPDRERAVAAARSRVPEPWTGTATVVQEAVR